MNNAKIYSIIFYSIVAVATLFIILSNPFLKIPYDPWEHLIKIASLHDEGKCFIFWPENEASRCFWHGIWANIFKLTGINDFFIWAKIIHVFQFFLAAIIVFYFSKTALTILINKKETIRIKFLSLFSVFLWFIGNGTFSMAYQQAWVIWYSVTPQGLTIPLFWYSTALTLKIFYEDLSLKKILFFIAQIAVISLIIVQAHATELLYYLIQLLVIFLINTKRIVRLTNKKVLFIFIPFIFLILFIVVRYFLPEQVPLLNLISPNETLVQKIQKINALGHKIVSTKLNRFPNSFSEVALISLIAAIMFRIFYFFIKEDTSFNRNFFDYLLASSILFFLIPLVSLFAGLGGYLTNELVVYRFFFASTWFIFLSFLIYRVLTMREINIPFYKFIITNVLILFSIIVFYKYFFHKTFIHNAKSFIISLDKKKVGVQYSINDINMLRGIIMNYEKSREKKPNLYYIRGDLSYIVRGVFRKYVFFNRDLYFSKKSYFESNELMTKYNLIDINPPENFPKDQEIFRKFPSLQKRE